VLSEAPPCLGPTAALPPDRYSFGHHHGVTPPASPQSFHSRQRPFLPAGPRSRRGAPDSAASLTGAGFDIRRIHGPSGGVHRTAGSEGARWASIPHLDKPGAPGTDFIARCNIQGSGPASSQQAAEPTPLLQWLRGQVPPTANYRNKYWCRNDPARPSRGNGRARLVLMLPMGRASNRLLHILSQGTGRGAGKPRSVPPAGRPHSAAIGFSPGARRILRRPSGDDGGQVGADRTNRLQHRHEPAHPHRRARAKRSSRPATDSRHWSRRESSARPSSHLPTRRPSRSACAREQAGPLRQDVFTFDGADK
jgi:hypothetical protein